jgi:hypothetical protein
MLTSHNRNPGENNRNITKNGYRRERERERATYVMESNPNLDHVSCHLYLFRVACVFYFI